MRTGGLACHAFEVAIAASGDEQMEKDGEIVAGVDDGGARDRMCLQADNCEDNGDTEEEDENRPREAYLLPVERSEKDTGEYG